jgi:DNA-binding CsgD family transcriptional regulator
MAPSNLSARVDLGISDHTIGMRLGISLRTAQHHTEHVLHKLGADRRSAVAALLLGISYR